MVFYPEAGTGLFDTGKNQYEWFKEKEKSGNNMLQVVEKINIKTPKQIIYVTPGNHCAGEFKFAYIQLPSYFIAEEFINFTFIFLSPVF